MLIARYGIFGIRAYAPIVVIKTRILTTVCHIVWLSKSSVDCYEPYGNVPFMDLSITSQVIVISAELL